MESREHKVEFEVSVKSEDFEQSMKFRDKSAGFEAAEILENLD